MNRQLDIESVEGEIALVIQYQPGTSEALTVLAGAMRLIEALDALDHCLLSSIDTTLEPVSILNDVQHSSLKILLARALRKIPDDAVGSLDWKKWIGNLLVKGKYHLLQKLDADDETLKATLVAFGEDYQAAPNVTAGYFPPTLADTRTALKAVVEARSVLPTGAVRVQTELGDIEIPWLSPDAVLLTPEDEMLTMNLLLDQVLIIESAVFKDGNQWRFSDGSASFAAAIADEHFLARIENGERFGKGDHLVVDLAVDQSRCGIKISTRRTVVRVRQHKDRHLQLVLF